jgi:multidrug efflux pump subunit AcrB
MKPATAPGTLTDNAMAGRAHRPGGGCRAAFEAVLRPLLDSAWPSAGCCWRRCWARWRCRSSLATIPNSRLGVVLKMLPFDNKSEFQVVLEMPAGTPLEDTAAALHELGAHLAKQPEVPTCRAMPAPPAPSPSTAWCASTTCAPTPSRVTCRSTWSTRRSATSRATPSRQRLRPELDAHRARHGGKLKVVEVPPGPPVQSPLVAEVYGPDEAGRQQVAARLEQAFPRHARHRRHRLQRCAPMRRAPSCACSASAPSRWASRWRQVAQTVQAALSGADAAWLHDGHSKYPVPVRLQLPREAQVGLDALLALPLRAANGALVPLSELVRVERGVIDKPLFTKDLQGVSYVFGDVGRRADGQAQIPDSPLYGLFAIRASCRRWRCPACGELGEYWIRQPADPFRQYAVKWDGESQITYETFRDMGAAYGVGLILIYLLVVAQFKSYLTPLVIMAPIPLTIIGVMPGHALLGAPFTATSMIGMIALAGIIVRNSILLVDFIELQVARGVAFKDAVVQRRRRARAADRADRLAAMIGAVFILDDPIFNGLAISLLFGIAVSTLLTLVVIPVLYYALYRRQPALRIVPTPNQPEGDSTMTVERYIRLMAGFFILLSLALGVEAAPSSSAPGGWPSPPSSAPTCSSRHHQLLPAGLLLKKLGVPEGGASCGPR